MSRALNVDDARLLFEYWCRVLVIEQIKWRIEWDSYHDPFTAVREYCGEASRARRQTVLKPWQKAKDTYELAKYKKGRRS